ncbi:hypothetical protein DFH09DRAFT_1335799 [Mycena vulgaris]|nr:hypothetical protein DFH09DRAFT_1335799 [Mycena vulgaris]
MASRRLLRARTLVVASFAAAVLFQSYGFVAQPTPTDYAVYAPHPYFLILFLVLQAPLQLWWIAQMFRFKTREAAPQALLADELDAFHADSDHSSTAPEPTQMAYVPVYALGNLCIVGSALAWEFEHSILSQVFMVSNAACHLYFVFTSLTSSGKYHWTPKNQCTHLVSKTSAGVAVLYMWKAWGVLDFGSSRPAIQQQVHCGVLFLLLAFASGPDPTLGICLLLDLAALAAGNTKEEWRFAFVCIMGVLFVVILSDCALAWMGRHAPNSTSLSHSRMDSEDDGEEGAFHDSDQIWLSDFTPERSERV